MYKRLLIVVLLVVITAGSAFKASASSLPASVAHVSQAAACTNADFMTGLGKDLTDLGSAFKTVDLKDPAATSQLFLGISSLRQKYEDMNLDPLCTDLQFEAILTFANASDILALALTAATDTANADTYLKAITDQSTRFQNNLQTVSIIAGVATPAPDATAPAGRISGITSGTCADAPFLTQLGQDMTGFSNTLSGTDMKDNAAVSKAVLGISALRQQYEDLKAPDGCVPAQLTMIIALANVTDLLGLTMAVKYDTKNADLYPKAMTNQSTRTVDWLKKVQQAATSSMATPAATAAS